MVLMVYSGWGHGLLVWLLLKFGGNMLVTYIEFHFYDGDILAFRITNRDLCLFPKPIPSNALTYRFFDRIDGRICVNASPIKSVPINDVISIIGHAREKRK